MKLRLSFLFLNLFVLAGWLGAQQPLAPEYAGKRSGRVNLSNGFYWGEVKTTAASESLAGFLGNEGITVSRNSRSGKHVLMRMRQVESIPLVPRGSRNGYSIRVEPNRIVIEYISVQGLSLACYQLENLIKREAFTRGTISKKRSLPCYEIRGWMTDEDLAAFRQQAPDVEIPLYATTVEAMLTDRQKGWLPQTDVLAKIGYTDALYDGNACSYGTLQQGWRQLSGKGVEVIPFFDLGGTHERFEQITGHPMLSVEGMRFVSALLDDFFTNTSFPAVGFIVPEGRYRKQIETIVARYPHITDLRFLDE